MKAQEKIDVRYLDETQKIKFASRIPKLARWYAEAFECFKQKNTLPYAPTLFVIPFYDRIESPVPGGKVILRLLASTSVDADDPYNKWAIYVPFNVIKNAPKEINIANLAHEIVHFSLRAKGLEALTPDEILQAAKEEKSSFEMYRMKEREVTNIEDLFEEPIRTMILRMEEEKTKHPDRAKKYLADSPALTQDEFFDKILGADKAQKLFEEQFRRMKERLGLDI